MSASSSHKSQGSSKLRPADSGRAELDLLRQKVIDLVRQKPAKAAIILTAWLHGSAASPKSTKKAG